MCGTIILFCSFLAVRKSQCLKCEVAIFFSLLQADMSTIEALRLQVDNLLSV